MIRKLRKLNNNADSLFITLPKYFVDILNLKEAQDIDITIKGKKIILNTKINENYFMNINNGGN